MQLIINLKIFLSYNFTSIINNFLFILKKFYSQKLKENYYKNFDEKEINVLSILQYSKNFNFHKINVKMFNLKNVNIYSIGLMLDKNNIPINIFENRNFKKKKKLRYLLPFDIKKKQTEIKGKTIFFCNPGRNTFNYFHFLIDFGMQLFILNQKKIKVDNLVLFSKKNNHREKFVRFFYPKIKFIYCNKNEFASVQNLIFLSPYFFSAHLNERTTKIFKKYKSFLERKLKLNKSQHSDKIIFINRQESRQLNNINNFKKIINFKEVLFSSYQSIKNQSNAIRKASIIIGLHGAGLTNIIFSNKKAKIVELIPEYYPNSCFERFSETLELNYKKIILKKNHFNKTVLSTRDIKEILKFIKKT